MDEQITCPVSQTEESTPATQSGCCCQNGGGCCQDKEAGGCCQSGATDLLIEEGQTPDEPTVRDALADELIQLPDPEPLPPPPARITVVDIHFRSGGKIYFFDPDGLTVRMGEHVIIETARGPEYGICAGGNHTVSGSDIVSPLRKVLRIATEQDEKIAAENREKEKKAYDVCQQKILEHKLDMQLVSAECAFDGSKILFFFTADGRVDFRELVKNLASVFRTRIELRQIGVRDKAKMVGGLGVCGRPFCCSQFLDDFQPVSIKMAKTQNLSLNPTKISGTCGRLMCCLKYEQDAYEDLLKTSPKPESFVDTEDGRGTVCDVNLLRQTVRVRMEDHPETIGVYRNDEIAILRNGKAKKTDPPIPRDLAPISSQPRQPKPQPRMDLDEQAAPALFKSMDAYANPAKEAVAETVPSAEGEKPRNRRRRRRGSGKGGERPEQPQQVQQAQPENQGQPQSQKPRRPEGKPHREKPQGEKPQGEKPQAQASAQMAGEGGEGKPRSNHRRRYRNRKPKEGGGAPPAQD